jgi:hypothetical protein
MVGITRSPRCPISEAIVKARVEGKACYVTTASGDIYVWHYVSGGWFWDHCGKEPKGK